MRLKIGHRLLAIREDRKLSQVELADILGVSPSTYSRIERNEASVEMEKLIAFASTFTNSHSGVTPRNILYRKQ